MIEKKELNNGYRFYVGIDTGVKTGFALWDKKKKELITIESMPIHRALNKVSLLFLEHGKLLFVRVEDARLRTWIPKQANERAERGRREGAGYVKAHAQIWEVFLKDIGCPYEMVAPKNNKTKLSAVAVKTWYNYKGETNEHGRDAASLVYGF